VLFFAVTYKYNKAEVIVAPSSIPEVSIGINPLWKAKVKKGLP
jgi:hypothetical protein